MARFIIKNKIFKVDKLKLFSSEATNLMKNYLAKTFDLQKN